jgi:hypothetical protein
MERNSRRKVGEERFEWKPDMIEARFENEFGG